jgi:hypothetical protein
MGEAAKWPPPLLATLRLTIPSWLGAAFASLPELLRSIAAMACHRKT